MTSKSTHRFPALNDKVDAIFWFTDLKDFVDQRALRGVAAFLKERGVRLYVRCPTRKPSLEIQEAAISTGGNWDYPARRKSELERR